MDALEKFRKRVKQLQKLHPKKAFRECQQLASKEKKSGKKIGAVKIIERGESRRTPAKKVVMAFRSKAGQFKGMKRVAGMPDDKYNLASELRSCENAISLLEMKYTKIAVALKLGNVAKTEQAAKKREMVHLKKIMRVESARLRSLKKLQKK